MAIFAGFGFAGVSENYWTATCVTLGVLCGSAIWWLFLCNASAFFRKWLTQARMRHVNRVSGLTMIIFAVGIFRKAIGG
jgi:arginine exporter protein ArgO